MLDRMTGGDWVGWQTYFRAKNRLRDAEDAPQASSDERVRQVMNAVWMNAQARKGRQ